MKILIKMILYIGLLSSAYSSDVLNISTNGVTINSEIAKFQLDYGYERNSFYLIHPTNALKIKCSLTNLPYNTVGNSYILQGEKNRGIVWTKEIKSGIQTWLPNFLKQGWILETNDMIRSFPTILALENAQKSNAQERLNSLSMMRNMSDPMVERELLKFYNTYQTDCRILHSDGSWSTIGRFQGAVVIRRSDGSWSRYE